MAETIQVYGAVDPVLLLAVWSASDGAEFLSFTQDSEQLYRNGVCIDSGGDFHNGESSRRAPART